MKNRPIGVIIRWLVVLGAVCALMPWGAVAQNNTLDEQLIERAMRGDIEQVKKLLDEGAKINSRDWLSRTPLIYAAENGHTAVVKLLITRGADVQARDRCGALALLYAVLGCHSETAEALIQKGADVNAKMYDFPSVVHVAVRKCSPEVVELLLKHGADVNVGDSQGVTPLHDAICDSPQIVALLLKHGADANSRTIADVRPLMCAAVFCEDVEPMKVLVENGADIAAKDNNGRTALDRARRSSKSRAIIDYLQSLNDRNTVKDRQ